MFRPGSTKRDMFWSARPKNLCFDQVRPCEIRFDRRDKKHLGFDKVPPSEIRFDRRHQNTYVSIKFDKARYVSTGATKTSKFRPSSTKRDRFRSARLQTSMFRPGSTKRDTFWPARPKHLCFDQVRSSEIFFDRRDKIIWLRTKFDWPRYVSISTSTNFYVSTKFNPARYVSTGATKTSRFWPSSPSEISFDRRDQNIIFRPSSTKRDTFWPAQPKHLCFDQFDQARYVLIGTTEKSMFRPGSTMRDTFRPARQKISRFWQSSTKWDTFRPAPPKYLCFDQVRPSEIRFDRRNQNI